MAIKAIINNTEKEIEQIKNSDEQDIDYVYSRIGDTEVEGELPISIKSIGGNLADYRIYGNTANGESVGDLETTGEHAGEYKVPVTVSNGADTLTTPIYLPEPIKMVGDEAEYIDYAEQKQHRVRKNLVQTIATSQTINGITFTVNANGSVTCNGTNHGNNPIIFELNNPDVVFPEGVYITSGCPAGGSITGGHKIQYFNGSSWNYELGSGSTFTLSGNLKYKSRILISKDVTVTNLTFYPMLRLASIADDTYEPYIENTDVDVTLPALSTIKGTNTLSVNTSTQPSNIYIKDGFDYKRVFTATRAIEGIPPLTYKAVEGALNNYRIYGNTVDGESVGDRTANLFNGELQNGYWSTLETLAQTSSTVFRSFKIFLPAGTYTITFATNVNIVRLIADGAITQNIGNNLTEYTFTTQTNDDVGFSFRITGTSLVPWDNSDIMLNIGSVAIPYEPYGYEVPVTINNVTTNFYLPEPLKMVGNDAEYVDFVEQKQYFADGTSISVNLPTIFASIGMNTICIETNVVPSGVRIKGKFKKITTTYIQSVEPDNTNNKIIFVVRAYLSKNDRMVRTGLVATNDPAIGVNINVNSTVITSGCKVFVKELAGVTPTTNNTKYTWTKTKITDGEIWYVRSYVEYINSDNEQLIIYSDAAKASLDGIIKTYTIT